MQVRRLILNEVGPFEHLDLAFPPGDVPDRADVHLLVGPNGAGKTTVLAAIAQCFSLGDAGFARRARGENAYAMVEHDDMWSAVAANPALPGDSVVDTARITLEDRLFTRRFASRPWGLFGTGQSDLLYATQLESAANTPVDGALFAYGALRSGGGAPVTGVVEQSGNPLADAASFGRSSGAAPFVQWLANAMAQRALSGQAGDALRGDALDVAITRVSEALSQVVGAPVRFALDLSPRFRLGVSVGDAPPVGVDQLPDGLQSLVAWLGDLLARLERIAWTEPGPVTDRRFVLLLDEVDVHLHPAWQREVLPMVERLFPMAQIICSTHSPFVIGSATDARIYLFSIDGGSVTVSERPRALGSSYSAIIDGILGVSAEFDVDSEERLERFRDAWKRCLDGDSTARFTLESEAQVLRQRSVELATIVGTELRELSHLIQLKSQAGAQR